MLFMTAQAVLNSLGPASLGIVPYGSMWVSIPDLAYCIAISASGGSQEAVHHRDRIQSYSTYYCTVTRTDGWSGVPTASRYVAQGVS